MDKIDKFTHGYIARHFYGQLTTVILFKDNISIDKLKKIYQNYPQGVFTKEHVNNLNECTVLDSKMLAKVMLLYTPVRSTPNVGVWDLVGTIFGSLEANSGIFVFEDFQDQLLFSGSINGLLPLLNLIKNRIDNKEQGLKLLHKFLEIISIAIQSIEGHEEMKNNFIKILFLLLEQVPRDFFQIKTIQQLAEIRFSLPAECNPTFFS